MQKITTFLWFDDKAEEAMEFYTSVFENSKVLEVSRYTEAGPGEPGSVMVGKFVLEGQEFLALNGGPIFKFTEAISLVVNCESQEEIDYYWSKLVEGGEESQCGWLKDKFGLSWQITPKAIGDLVTGDDPARSKRVMEALFQMKKIDLSALRRAYDGA